MASQSRTEKVHESPRHNVPIHIHTSSKPSQRIPTTASQFPDAVPTLNELTAETKIAPSRSARSEGASPGLRRLGRHQSSERTAPLARQDSGQLIPATREPFEPCDGVAIFQDYPMTGRHPTCAK